MFTDHMNNLYNMYDMYNMYNMNNIYNVIDNEDSIFVRSDNYVPLVPYMPANPKPGYGYIPYQINPKYYSNAADGLINGTMFPDLTTPYTG